MSENIIIKRVNIPVANSYDYVVEDFGTAFSGFDGVEFETIPASEDTKECFLIYIDSSKEKYLKITTNDYNKAVLSIHNTTVNNDTASISGAGEKVNNFNTSYIVIRTAYGVAFSPIDYFYSSNDSEPEGGIRCFFTTFNDENGNKVNTLIYNTVSSDNDTSGTVCTLSSIHVSIERLDYAKYYFGGSKAVHTLLTNAASYQYPLVSDTLYKKVQSEANKFGLVELGGKKFIAGSIFCLLYEEE